MRDGLCSRSLHRSVYLVTVVVKGRRAPPPAQQPEPASRWRAACSWGPEDAARAATINTCITMVFVVVPAADRAGIYTAFFDSETGTLSQPTLAAAQKLSPSWLRWHPALPVLYATGETWDGSPSTLSSYRLGKGGELSLTGVVETSGGSACHTSLHPSPSSWWRPAHIAVAHHGLPGHAAPNSTATSGSVGIVQLDLDNGRVHRLSDVAVHPLETDPRLRAHPGRQDWTSHAHSASWSRSGKWLFVTEKGVDLVIVYVSACSVSVLLSSERCRDRRRVGVRSKAWSRHLALAVPSYHRGRGATFGCASLRQICVRAAAIRPIRP